jgi:hypothetical protein
MRSLVALTDARFALIPVELRFEAVPPSASVDVGSRRAILRLVLVDARLAEIQWTGDVAVDVHAPPTSAVIAGDLARRLADLLVAP